MIYVISPTSANNSLKLRNQFFIMKKKKSFKLYIRFAVIFQRRLNRYKNAVQIKLRFF